MLFFKKKTNYNILLILFVILTLFSVIYFNNYNAVAEKDIPSIDYNNVTVYDMIDCLDSAIIDIGTKTNGTAFTPNRPFEYSKSAMKFQLSTSNLGKGVHFKFFYKGGYADPFVQENNKGIVISLTTNAKIVNINCDKPGTVIENSTYSNFDELSSVGDFLTVEVGLYVNSSKNYVFYFKTDDVLRFYTEYSYFDGTSRMCCYSVSNNSQIKSLRPYASVSNEDLVNGKLTYTSYPEFNLANPVEKEVKIIPDVGYKLSSLKVNGVDVTSNVENDIDHRLNIAFYKYFVNEKNIIFSAEFVEDSNLIADSPLDLFDNNGIICLEIPKNDSNPYMFDVDPKNDFSLSFKVENCGLDNGIQFNFMPTANALWNNGGINVAITTNARISSVNTYPQNEGYRQIFVSYDCKDISCDKDFLLTFGLYTNNANKKIFFLKINGELRVCYEFDNMDRFGNIVTGYSVDTTNITTTKSICELNITTGENGVVEGSKYVIIGEKANLKIIPYTGYKVKTILIGSENKTNELPVIDHKLNIVNYSFTVPTSATVYVDFEKDEDSLIDVFDFYDISGKTDLTVQRATTIYSFGSLPRTENVAFKMVLNVGSTFVGNTLDAQRQIGFFESPSRPLWTSYGFEISFYWKYCARFQFKGDTSGTLNQCVLSVILNNEDDILIEIGVFDSGENLATVYLKFNNELALLQEFNKDTYNLGTGVGGLYVASSTDVDGLITAKTSYDYVGLSFDKKYDEINLSSYSSYAVLNKDLVVFVNKGYILNKVYINNVDVTSFITFNDTKDKYIIPVGTYTDDIVLSFETEYIEKNINIDFDSSKLSCNYLEKVLFKDNVIIEILPNVGYDVSSFKIGNEELVSKLVKQDNKYVYTIFGVLEDLDIKILSVEKTFSIEVEFDSGVYVEYKNEISAYDKTEIKVNIIDGLKLKTVTLNGEEVFLTSDGKLVIDSVNDDLEIKIATEQINNEGEENEGGCSSNIINYFSLFSFFISLLPVCLIVIIKQRRTEDEKK